MNKYINSSLFILSLFAAFWAYTIIDSLLREFSASVTFIDLAVLFVLGFIGGIPAGIGILSIARKKPAEI
jgi:hypothetical protein